MLRNYSWNFTQEFRNYPGSAGDPYGEPGIELGLTSVQDKHPTSSMIAQHPLPHYIFLHYYFLYNFCLATPSIILSSFLRITLTSI